jgi:uncharacterized phiE125 gp8 family phage protein
MMTLRLITPPTVEPVSLETVKQHLRIDTTAEDGLLDLYIAAARERAEGLSRRALIQQTLEAVYDEWPHNNYVLAVPRPPLLSVTSIKYYDDENVEHTWTDYIVDTRSEPGKIIFNSLPGDSLLESGGVVVRFVAGYGDAPAEVPGTIRQAILMTVGHWYENRETTISGTIIAEVPDGPKEALMNERPGWF